jgi:2-polyprenyl-6-methoxyphenol hydroxylase-like FAD-dependent oxidoreductase
MKLWNPANDVIALEQSKEGVTHGWGVTMEQNFLATLASLDPESAEELEWRSIRWRDQVVCFGGGREVSRDSRDACGLSRQRFVDLLAARAGELGVDIRNSREVDARSGLPNADLIVAADGGSSQVRASIEFGTSITEGRNKYIWLGTGKMFDSFNFFFEETEAGWIWAYAYQHESTTSTFIVECEPQTWAGLGFDTCAPGRMLGRLEEIFADHLSGRRLWTQFTDGTDAQWLNFAAVRNKRWHHGNVVLAGDSAQTEHFSSGLGTILAMEDVIALAHQLRRAGYPEARRGQGRLTEALAAYQKQRRAERRARARKARRSALWFENVPRYTDLTPRQFAVALRARRSALLPKLPPRLFCQLHDIGRYIGIADKPR